MILPKTICMLPWVSLETSPTGTARPCCLAREEITDENGEKYRLTDTPLQTIYKSTYMQDLRKQFRAGEKPETCKLCWDEEAAGRTSKRMNSSLRFKEFTETKDVAELNAIIDWANDTPDQLWSLDLKLGNICNLKCRICGSWSSSKWASEEMDYVKSYADPKKHIAYTWLKQGAWPRNADTFWENLKALLPNIKYFEFTGGEPWMIQEHVDLLQYAVDNGFSKGIDIHYNTNGTISPETLAPLWGEFGRVDIAFSVDNVGDRFEYERYGAKWDMVNYHIGLTTVARANEWPNITTQLCFTVNIQNVYYIDELLSWADTKHFGSIYFNMLHSPDHMSVQYMTPAAQELVLNKLKTHFWTTTKYQQEISNVINFIENGKGSDGSEFLSKMQQTDAYRKQSFMTTHPEIARAMGYE